MSTGTQVNSILATLNHLLNDIRMEVNRLLGSGKSKPIEDVLYYQQLSDWKRQLDDCRRQLLKQLGGVEGQRSIPFRTGGMTPEERYNTSYRHNQSVNAKSKSIQKAIEEYPRLEKIFHETMKEYDTDKPVYDEDGNWKDFEFVEKTYAYKFLNEMGFCFTRFSICNNTPKRELTDMEDVLTTIDNEMTKLDNYSYNESKKIDLLNRKLRCFKCKESSNGLTIKYMIHLLLKNIFNLDLEYWKFEEMFNLDVDYWNHEEMDNLLNKLKKDN